MGRLDSHRPMAGSTVARSSPVAQVGITRTPLQLKEVHMRGSSHFAALTFQLASEIWLEDQELYVKPATVRFYRKNINRLLKRFAGVTLADFHIGHFKHYQKELLGGIRNESINSDLATLGRILGHGGLWEEIKKDYKALPLPRWTPPRVMTEREEEGFFALALSNPDYMMAYSFAGFTNNTSASGCEIRGLRLRHLDLSPSEPVVYIPSDSVKNEYRARVVPLNDEAVRIAEFWVKRAHRLGASQPEHFLLPFRVCRGQWDPTRHVNDWFIYKYWTRLVDKAMELKVVGFRVRPHDLRHQIITKMLENGAPEQTVMAIAGHVRREMTEHYSHHRLHAKKAAISILNRKKEIV
jgi:integrase